ncbi:hypothetical protein [Burkholderia guangdongensis]|nr:hypothetical protein [Burkholderia guangdongensis]
MKAAANTLPTSSQWFFHLRQMMSRAWEAHVRNCELIAEAHRRM